MLSLILINVLILIYYPFRFNPLEFNLHHQDHSLQMLRLSKTPRNHTVHFRNLHLLDRDLVYEVKITGFHKCTKTDDNDIQHDLGNLDMCLLEKASHLYLSCKLLGWWRISMSVRDAVCISFTNKNYIFFF